MGSALALTASIAFGQVASSPTDEALTLVRDLRGDDRVEAARELLWRLEAWTEELEASAASDVRLAAVIAGVTLADHVDALDAPRPERLELLREARRIVDTSIPNEYVAWVDYALAVELVSLGDLEEAAGRLEEALAGPTLGSAYELAASHLLVEVLRRETRWEDALLALEELDARVSERELAASEPELELLAWKARVHGSRGLIEQGLGRLDMALREHRAEGDFAERSGDLVVQVAHRLNRCDLALMTEDYDYVESSLMKLGEEPVFRTLPPERVAQFGLFLGLAQSELERGDPERVRRARGTLQHVAGDAWLPGSERFVVERALVDLALRRGDFERARGHLDRLAVELGTRSDSDGAEAIFVATLEARWVLDQGLEGAVFRAAYERLVRLWPSFLEEWSRTPLWPGGTGFLHHAERREILGTLTRLALAAEPGRAGAETALGYVAQAQAMGTLARRAGLAAPTLAELRASWLQAKHGVLYFLPSRERTHLFGFDRDGAWHEELEARDALRDELTSFLALLRRNPERVGNRGAHAAALERAAAAVSHALLPASLDARLRAWDAVTVVGTEHLGGLPPALLQFTDGAWWGEELAVDVVPSLPLALELATRAVVRRPTRDTLVLFATLAPGAAALARWPGLQERALSQAELARLVAPFPGRSTRAFLGPEATRGAILATDLREAAVVHILAHGVHLEDRERGAALALHGSDEAVSLLTCEDVEDQLEVSGVVLLSACATARGPDRPGDDNLAHLGGAFLRAGARAVVLSQVPVELAPTLALMELVHAGLADGVSPAEAFRTALRAARSGVDPLAPWIVGQFDVLGAGHVPLF